MWTCHFKDENNTNLKTGPIWRSRFGTRTPTQNTGDHYEFYSKLNALPYCDAKTALLLLNMFLKGMTKKFLTIKSCR